MRRGQLIAATAAAAIVLLTAFAAPAAARDRNRDLLPDRWEKRYRLSLKVKQTRRDQDRDKLRNRKEFVYGTSPRNADTDGDGLADGMEVWLDYDPTDPDSDGDDIPDGAEIAGTVAGFDGSMLTVSLFRGGSVSGLVNEDTSIDCDRPSSDEDLDGVCFMSDLVPGTVVSGAEFDEDVAGLFSELELVGFG